MVSGAGKAALGAHAVGKAVGVGHRHKVAAVVGAELAVLLQESVDHSACGAAVRVIGHKGRAGGQAVAHGDLQGRLRAVQLYVRPVLQVDAAQDDHPRADGQPAALHDLPGGGIAAGVVGAGLRLQRTVRYGDVAGHVQHQAEVRRGEGMAVQVKGEGIAVGDDHGLLPVGLQRHGAAVLRRGRRAPQGDERLAVHRGGQGAAAGALAGVRVKGMGVAPDHGNAPQCADAGVLHLADFVRKGIALRQIVDKGRAAAENGPKAAAEDGRAAGIGVELHSAEVALEDGQAVCAADAPRAGVVVAAIHKDAVAALALAVHVPHRAAADGDTGPAAAEPKRPHLAAVDLNGIARAGVLQFVDGAALQGQTLAVDRQRGNRAASRRAEVRHGKVAVAADDEVALLVLLQSSVLVDLHPADHQHAVFTSEIKAVQVQGDLAGDHEEVLQLHAAQQLHRAAAQAAHLGRLKGEGQVGEAGGVLPHGDQGGHDRAAGIAQGLPGGVLRGREVGAGQDLYLLDGAEVGVKAVIAVGGEHSHILSGRRVRPDEMLKGIAGGQQIADAVEPGRGIVDEEVDRVVLPAGELKRRLGAGGTVVSIAQHQRFHVSAADGRGRRGIGEPDRLSRARPAAHIRPAQRHGIDGFKGGGAGALGVAHSYGARLHADRAGELRRVIHLQHSVSADKDTALHRAAAAEHHGTRGRGIAGLKADAEFFGAAGELRGGDGPAVQVDGDVVVDQQMRHQPHVPQQHHRAVQAALGVFHRQGQGGIVVGRAAAAVHHLGHKVRAAARAVAGAVVHVAVGAAEAALAAVHGGVLMALRDQVAGVVIAGVRLGQIAPGAEAVAGGIVIALQQGRTLDQAVRQGAAGGHLQPIGQYRARIEQHIAAGHHDGPGVFAPGAADHRHVAAHGEAAAADKDGAALAAMSAAPGHPAVQQHNAAAGHLQGQVAVGVAGVPVMALQVDGEGAAADGDVLIHRALQLYPAAARLRGGVHCGLEGGVLHFVILRRQPRPAGALLPGQLVLGLLNIGMLPGCARPAAGGAALAVGQPVGVGGQGKGMLLLAQLLAADAPCGVPALAVGGPGVGAVGRCVLLKAAQGALRNMLIGAVLCILPLVPGAPLEGKGGRLRAQDRKVDIGRVHRFFRGKVGALHHHVGPGVQPHAGVRGRAAAGDRHLPAVYQEPRHIRAGVIPAAPQGGAVLADHRQGAGALLLAKHLQTLVKLHTGHDQAAVNGQAGAVAEDDADPFARHGHVAVDGHVPPDHIEALGQGGGGALDQRIVAHRGGMEPFRVVPVVVQIVHGGGGGRLYQGRPVHILLGVGQGIAVGVLKAVAVGQQVRRGAGAAPDAVGPSPGAVGAAGERHRAAAPHRIYLQGGAAAALKGGRAGDSELAVVHIHARGGALQAAAGDGHIAAVDIDGAGVPAPIRSGGLDGAALYRQRA